MINNTAFCSFKAKQNQKDSAGLQVTLVGAGRYGDGLIGPKYASRKWSPNAELIAVIDKKTLDKTSSLSEFPQYTDIKEWKKGLNRDISPNDVVEIALKPEIVPGIFESFCNEGVQKFILPKPITYNEFLLSRMKRIANQKNIRTAITSQEYYSLLTKLTKEVIKKVQTPQSTTIPSDLMEYKNELDQIKNTKPFEIEKVTLRQVKERETISDTTPPSCEFPHEVEILSATGILNFKDKNYDPKVVSASRYDMAVHYDDSAIKHGIDISTDLGHKANTESGRMFELAVYLNDGDPEPDIVTDYDVRFNNTTSICKKPGSIKVDIGQGKNRINWTRQIEENKLIEMYKKIFKAFSSSPNKDDNSVLCIDEYIPSAKQVMKAQKNWETFMLEQGYSQSNLTTIQSHQEEPALVSVVA